MNLRDHAIHGVDHQPIPGRWSTGWDFAIIPPVPMVPCGGEGCEGGEGPPQIDFKCNNYAPAIQPITVVTPQWAWDKALAMGYTGDDVGKFRDEVIRTVKDLARITGTRVEGVYEP